MRLRRALREVRLTPEGERPRYAGGPLTRYLIRAMTALVDSGARDLVFAEDGRRLLDTIDRVTADIQEHDPGPTTLRWRLGCPPGLGYRTVAVPDPADGTGAA